MNGFDQERKACPECVGVCVVVEKNVMDGSRGRGWKPWFVLVNTRV